MGDDTRPWPMITDSYQPFEGKGVATHESNRIAMILKPPNGILTKHRGNNSKGSLLWRSQIE